MVMYRTRVKWQPILLAALMLLMTACYSGGRPPRIGQTAPDFSLQDGSGTIALHDYKGKVVVLNFWATWCPPCVEEMPSLIRLQSELRDKGVTVLAVSLDVDENAYRRFLRDHNVNLTAVRDPGQKSSSLYGTFQYPETYIIDRKGVVRRKFIGPVDWTQPSIVSYLSRM